MNNIKKIEKLYNFIIKDILNYNEELISYLDTKCEDFIQKEEYKNMDLDIDNFEIIMEEMTNYIGYRISDFNYEKAQQEKKIKLNESLRIETEKGYKYIIDNRLDYYYLVGGDYDEIETLDFKYIFENSLHLGYVDDFYYKRIEKYLGKEAVKYFYYVFKTELLKKSELNFNKE